MGKKLPLALLTALTACNPVDLKEIEEDTGGCGRGLRCSTQTISVRSVAQVDLLVVVDNSGSMAPSQAKLVAGLEALLERLQESRLGLDLRVAFTTTDRGNPLCPSSTPESGAFVLSSCLDRVDAGEFLYEGVDPSIDGSFACTDRCSLSDAALTIRPTATKDDPQLKPRSWVELGIAESNLPEGVSLAEAIACFAPQGIAGCGYESPLESMFLALHRSESAGDINAGFLRPQATLAVVLVTDEVDCSYNPAHEDVFLTEKALWSDPEAAAPTSALCWRAGVECIGDPAGYASCSAKNVGVDGTVGVDDGEAVLHPMSRYLEDLEELEQERTLFDSGAEVLIAVIGGVPEGYAGEELSYSAAVEQAYLDEFGIDPGCVGLNGDTAAPPVRLRELEEAHRVGDPEHSLLSSICAPAFDPALVALGDHIVDQLGSACMPECVRDVDTTTPTLEVNCTVRDLYPTLGEARDLSQCEGDADSPTPPEGELSCWFPIVDRDGQTPSPADDMSEKCAEDGWNLEFGFIRGEPLLGAAVTDVICELSDLPEIECPHLGG